MHWPLCENVIIICYVRDVSITDVKQYNNNNILLQIILCVDDTPSSDTKHYTTFTLRTGEYIQ